MAEIWSALVDCFVGWALDLVKQELEYVFSYRSFIATLGDKNERLRRLLPDVQGLVNDAELNGEDITEKLKALLLAIGKKQTEADNLLKENSEVQTHCWDFVGDCNCPLRNAVAKNADSLAKEMKDLIQEVHGYKVLKKLKPPPLGPTLALGYKPLDSREGYLKKLRAALLEEKKLVIGVYGEARVGKTMLVEQLAKEMEAGEHFRHIVVMSGRSVRSKDGVIDIQQLIAERIGFALNLKNVDERKRMVNQRLTSIKEVLIIIDNVNETFDLNKIGIPVPVNNDDCRIVLVSHSKTACKKLRSQLNLEVKPLTNDERQELKFTERKFASYASFQSSIVEFQNGPLPRLPSNSSSTLPSNGHDEKVIMLDAHVLEIAEVKKAQCWRWEPDPSTYSLEILRLIKVWHLHIEGRTNELTLYPGTYYVAYFVYKLVPGEAEAFETDAVEFTVSGRSKSCCLDPSIAASLYEKNLIEKSGLPMEREDGWMEIVMGSFYNNQYPVSEVNLLVKNYNDNVVKSGLLVRGIELRPLEPFYEVNKVRECGTIARSANVRVDSAIVQTAATGVGIVAGATAEAANVGIVNTFGAIANAARVGGTVGPVGLVSAGVVDAITTITTIAQAANNEVGGVVGANAKAAKQGGDKISIMGVINKIL